MPAAKANAFASPMDRALRPPKRVALSHLLHGMQEPFAALRRYAPRSRVLRQRLMRFFIVALTSALLGAGLCFPQAHEAQTGQDYTKYRQRNGMSCCSGHDCRPARYELKPDGSVVMYPEGRPVSIPGDRVTQDPSDDGLAHWCGVLHGNGSATTFCAILPLHAASGASHEVPASAAPSAGLSASGLTPPGLTPVSTRLDGATQAPGLPRP